ncbi:hypothetical protein MM236_17800 [Belliella sp. DSM 107340]|uniref:Uncharacterized protein n=1 Tax=Belliella calami TaxID=2923436 RepID=A0ABS9UTM1_9BACT|nr:hypothetical protein [Belliella calami]MCH7399853.1 hypothetical protein [Belliella calami]
MATKFEKDRKGFFLLSFSEELIAFLESFVSPHCQNRFTFFKIKTFAHPSVHFGKALKFNLATKFAKARKGFFLLSFSEELIAFLESFVSPHCQNRFIFFKIKTFAHPSVHCG